MIFPHEELGSGQRAFQIVQQDFKKIGIGISLKVLNDPAAWQAIIADDYRSFDLAFWDWDLSIDPDFILSFMTCDSWDVWNDSGYCNKEYDRLYSEQQMTTSPAERLQIIYRMQDMIYEQTPYIILTSDDNRMAWSPKWTGFVPSPLGEFSSLSKQSLLGAHQVSGAG